VARPVSVKKKIRAIGYPIPPSQIVGHRKISVPKDILDRVDLRETDDTSTKGDKAILVAKEMIERGLVLNGEGRRKVEIVTDKRRQIQGKDLIVDEKWSIQVKCDWKAGPKGTGNLFLQIAECNPEGAH
jgi:hypothetical protein